MKKLILSLGAAALLSACASTTTTSPVLTRADGTFETTGLGTTKLRALEAALSAAQKQCDTRSSVIISDKTTNNGVLDERTGRMIEQGASVVGAVFGQATPNLSRDDDYEYQIKFQCR